MSMFLASRTRQRTKITVLVIAAYVLVVGVLAALFTEKNGTYSDAFLWWLVGVPVGLVVWLGLEWCGTTLVSFPFWQKVPSVIRVALLVMIIAAVIIASMIIKQLAYAL